MRTMIITIMLCVAIASGMKHIETTTSVLIQHNQQLTMISSLGEQK